MPPPPPFYAILIAMLLVSSTAFGQWAGSTDHLAPGETVYRYGKTILGNNNSSPTNRQLEISNVQSGGTTTGININKGTNSSWELFIDGNDDFNIKSAALNGHELKIEGSPGLPAGTVSIKGGQATNIVVPPGQPDPTTNTNRGGDVILQGGDNPLYTTGQGSGDPIDPHKYGTVIFQPVGGEGARVGIGVNEPRSKLHVDGRVIIGTTEPVGDYAPTGATPAKLSVEGPGVFGELAVTDVDAWADYVFTPTHERMSLEQVEQYIQKNGHLPNVPSEKQVKENGYNVAKMDAILLEKIEELMLHVIELKKENNDLKKKIAKK